MNRTLGSRCELSPKIAGVLGASNGVFGVFLPESQAGVAVSIGVFLPRSQPGVLPGVVDEGASQRVLPFSAGVFPSPQADPSNGVLPPSKGVLPPHPAAGVLPPSQPLPSNGVFPPSYAGVFPPHPAAGVLLEFQAGVFPPS
ncbi:hypothetical protein O9G_003327 [Rozella allomycis CSF55]|uniref:Uncharacterized protein n=1 Tax=Rozella allomycis (strain CSF55) TaxID=988480 RepID=A0A075B1J2_ROZAC|nr:hypothetical protein O9G_003327 [Rozella allomycis CSF55]|eukprot:EPZ36456.1 hypothetical protein O9G_003327 [Rozella allomycis CSF55]